MLLELKSARRLRWIIPLAIFGAIVAIIYAATIYFLPTKNIGPGQPVLLTRILMIGSTSLNAEVASTGEEQKNGLSNRRGLAPDAGMLFPIDPPSRPGFWMKEMNFPLDFIYLFQGHIVEIKENVSPSSFPELFFPTENVDAVLEVNAGWVATHGIRANDQAGY